MKNLRNLILSILFALGSISSQGQGRDSLSLQRVPKHFLSVNPLTLSWQQAGVTYEFKPGWFGLAVSTGYMYANNWNPSYFFVNGPVEHGSLGYYSGVYVIPQLNFYFATIKSREHAVMFYAALRGVYRFMTVGSKNYIPWDCQFLTDEEVTYLKMDDKVNIRAAYVNIGMKFVHDHFFMDVNGGYGILDVHHVMTVYGYSTHPGPGGLYPVPLHDTYYDWHMAVNVNFNLGFAF